jgi:hypothetical protein
MPAAWGDYFGTRKWRVAKELDGTATAEPGTELNPGTEPVRVEFSHGKFEIIGGVFHSPLSSARGRKGILLQEVSVAGEDIEGSRVAVGVVVFRRARSEGAIG